MENENKKQADPFKDALMEVSKEKSEFMKCGHFEQQPDRNFIPMVCPNCHGEFGLDEDKIVANRDNSYRYGCPYCDGEYTIKNT